MLCIIKKLTLVQLISQCCIEACDNVIQTEVETMNVRVVSVDELSMDLPRRAAAFS